MRGHQRFYPSVSQRTRTCGSSHLLYDQRNKTRRQPQREKKKKTNALFYVVHWFHYINPPAALSHKNPFTSQTLSLSPSSAPKSLSDIKADMNPTLPHALHLHRHISESVPHLSLPSFFYATPSLESLMGPLKTQFIFIMRSLWTASSLYSPSQRRDWNWSLLLDVIVSKTWSQLGESTV